MQTGSGGLVVSCRTSSPRLKTAPDGELCQLLNLFSIQEMTFHGDKQAVLEPCSVRRPSRGSCRGKWKAKTISACYLQVLRVVHQQDRCFHSANCLWPPTVTKINGGNCDPSIKKSNSQRIKMTFTTTYIATVMSMT